MVAQATAHAQSTARPLGGPDQKQVVLDDEDKLIEVMLRYRNDPYGFVMYAFPWGVPGTILEHETGPDDWQAEFLKRLGQELERRQDGNITRALQMATASGHGVGKFESVNHSLDTPDGVRRWGDLKPGDRVFGSNGKPTVILMTHPQGVKPIYRVRFDDGSSAMVGDEHLWNVRGRQQRRNGLKPFVTMTTADIVRAGVKRSNGFAEARQWEIPIQGAAEFEEGFVHIHPYLMGVWIGDGTINSPQYSKREEEIVTHLTELKYKVNDRPDGITKYIYGSRTAFRRYQVYGCKSPERYIPEEYKYNSVENRWELLRGLLDTDGECESRGQIIYGTTSKRLAEDVAWLVRSLGGKAMLQPTIKNAWYSDENGVRIKCKDCYRVTIRFGGKPRLFYIERKQCRVVDCESRYTKRWIESIEYSHDEEAMCITVAAKDALYLTNDFIVTHNTALVSWLVIWFMSTRTNIKGVVTANTKQQLTDTTWVELSKWHKLAINEHWFKWTATKFASVSNPNLHFITASPWSKHNTEAFAGKHQQNVLMIFDEASAVEDIIWEVASGAMTTAGAMWFAFGNPTRNVGRFRQCWTKFRKRWITYRVDARKAKKADQQQIQDWIDDYGEDSDFVRVRVKGVFPRASSMQFIPLDFVEQARLRKMGYDSYKDNPIVIGVDVARYGDDRTCIAIRQGLHLIEIREYREVDTMTTVSLVAQAEDEYGADAVFIDETGPGAGVIDRGRQLKRRWMNVVAGSVSSKSKFFNKRAEMWSNMRDWVRIADLSAVDDKTYEALETDLTGIEYGFSQADKIQLERKEDMKKRDLDSPDYADALAQTFAFRVKPKFDRKRDDYDYEDRLQHRRGRSARKARDRGKSRISGY